MMMPGLRPRTSTRLIAYLGAVATALLLGTAGAATAQEKFPTRPVTLINPWAAGGPVDIHMRGLAPLLEKALGQPVIIENKPGASGSLGPATMAATAKPDGYTIAEMPSGMFILPHMQKVSFNPKTDFTYIIHLTAYRFLIAVPAESPWKTWKEFVAYAKENPGKIRYGSTGTGGTLHLGTEDMMASAGGKLTHVPFRGASEQIAAILGNHVEAVATGGLAFPLIEQGTLRGLISWTPKRNPRIPNVPTLAEEGITTNFDWSGPYGIAGPKGMSPRIVKILHDAFKTAQESPEGRAVLEKIEQDYIYMNSADYTKFAMDQTAAAEPMLKRMGLMKE
jgi:tripartite-type tricarboxylate transporter receptor subunit TctC